MKDTDLYRQILGIESPWEVSSVALDAKALRIDVVLVHKGGQRWSCPECQETCGLHDHADERSWRHLDSCQFQTIIRARLPRVRCPEHGVRLVRVPWAEPGSRFTNLFEALAVRVLRETSVSGGAGLLKVSWDEAQGLMARARHPRRRPPHPPPRRRPPPRSPRALAFPAPRTSHLTPPSPHLAAA